MKFKEIISDYWKEISLLKKGVAGVCLLLLTGAGFLFYFSLPTPLFNSSYSTVLEDRNGILIGAKIEMMSNGDSYFR